MRCSDLLGRLPVPRHPINDLKLCFANILIDNLFGVVMIAEVGTAMHAEFEGCRLDRCDRTAQLRLLLPAVLAKDTFRS